jgi:HlyD family secretion protein
MTRKKALIFVVVLLVGAAVVAANLWFQREPSVSVTSEAIRARDLEAVVSASGRIRPKRQVNISANQMGRVTRLAVAEGQQVKAGQFLLEIDPRSLEGALQRGAAGVAAAESALQQARVSVDQAQANLSLARQNLNRQEQLWREGLTTREALERAQNEVAVRETEYQQRQQEIETREQQIRQERASLATTQYNLTQVIINSPMDGIVTRRNIEEGETAVVGTMNNAGTVLLTIADMSVLEAEVEVDETDIPTVFIGQEARVTIDAVANRTFHGRVTEIGNSPIQTTGTQATGQRQATSFKVVVTLDEQIPDVRPGFTATAEISTATRQEVVSVPIQSLAVREMLFDETGQLVREPPVRRRRGTDMEPTVSASTEPPPGHTRREVEGVFVVRDGRAVFTPITVGIAGERYFEVLEGLNAGDQVVTGPFASVRELMDGSAVSLQSAERRR